MHDDDDVILIFCKNDVNQHKWYNHTGNSEFLTESETTCYFSDSLSVFLRDDFLLHVRRMQILCKTPITQVQDINIPSSRAVQFNAVSLDTLNKTSTRLRSQYRYTKKCNRR